MGECLEPRAKLGYELTDAGIAMDLEEDGAGKKERKGRGWLGLIPEEKSNKRLQGRKSKGKEGKKMEEQRK
jgi:hypothetical protein